MKKRLDRLFSLHLGKVTILVILFLAFILRTNNINWDEGHHLHPDERFLTMVTNAMKLPVSISQYLDPKTSQMNPANIGFPFFVYGLLPLLVVKMVAIIVGFDNYSLNLLGRLISAIFDCISVLIIYLLVLELEKNKFVGGRVKYFSAFFYAIFTLPIQLSHYYANDIILSTFTLLSVYFSTVFWFRKKILFSILSGVAMGFAFASKISALYTLPLIIVLLLIAPMSQLNQKGRKFSFFIKTLIASLFSLVLFGVAMYLAMRIGSPYYFETGNFFDLTVSKLFRKNLQELRAINGFHVWFPPAIHWMSKGFELVIHKPDFLCKEIINKTCAWTIYPSWFALKMFSVFGVGLIATVFGVIGIIAQLLNQLKSIKFKKFNPNTIILLGISIFFVYQSIQFVKSYRYYIWIYPFFAVFAGVGIVATLDLIKKRLHNHYIYSIVVFFISATTLIWPLMFMRIYTSPHTRISASKWIYQHIDNNSLLLIEHWDDGLPLNLATVETKNKRFRSEYVEVFAQDNDEKFEKIYRQLQNADYYIISSGRSIATTAIVPWKYPQMGRFYQQMISGELGYKQVAEFTSYPRLELFGSKFFEVNDEFEDDALIVYDHPKVLIFKNIKK